MHISQDISLKKYNTFGIDVKAKHFCSVTTIADLQEALSLSDYPNIFILGGGSNILLTKNMDALVIHINIKGIEIITVDEYAVMVKANAGENWHEFVLWCLDHDFGGLENLSLIPGNVGTAPVQNIGAYGVELKDSFISCEAISISNKSIKTFNKADCSFDYRNSVFKQEFKDKFVITSVTFKLSKTPHVLRTGYGAITEELNARGINNPTIQDISKAVIAIRNSKLPNPKEIGNSGSFFKNPIITKTQYVSLLKSFPQMPNYRVSDDEVKIPAGWLIEKAGFKGKTFGNFGVHNKQALVLVNYGGANGTDILNLAKLIQATVQRLFGISIVAEVNIL